MTHMILEVYDGQILLRSAEHSAHFPKTAEVLFNDILSV